MAKKDFYSVLIVTRSASSEELRKAYKKLAMQWHPDRNPSHFKTEAEARFKEISEAYDVLNDPVKRRIYDVYGEAGLEFDDLIAAAEAAEEKRRDRERDRDRWGRKGEPQEVKFFCSLEELYTGCVKKVKITRTVVVDRSGMTDLVVEKEKIEIKAGWKKGTKITFPGKGDQQYGYDSSDLIYVVDEHPHPIFKRQKDDLIIHKKLTLLEALTGKTLKLMLLDGRTLTIELTEIVTPGYELVIQNEGMPIVSEPGKKGVLKIKFDVKFPSRLSAQQKSVLRSVLASN